MSRDEQLVRQAKAAGIPQILIDSALLDGDLEELVRVQSEGAAFDRDNQISDVEPPKRCAICRSELRGDFCPTCGGEA